MPGQEPGGWIILTDRYPWVKLYTGLCSLFTHSIIKCIHCTLSVHFRYQDGAISKFSTVWPARGNYLRSDIFVHQVFWSPLQGLLYPRKFIIFTLLILSILPLPLLFCDFLCVSVSPSVSLSLHVSLSASLSLYLHLCTVSLSASLYLYLNLWLSICISVSLSASLFSLMARPLPPAPLSLWPGH